MECRKRTYVLIVCIVVNRIQQSEGRDGDDGNAEIREGKTFPARAAGGGAGAGEKN